MSQRISPRTQKLQYIIKHFLEFMMIVSAHFKIVMNMLLDRPISPLIQAFWAHIQIKAFMLTLITIIPGL